MKKKIFLINLIIIIFANIMIANAATVINKDDAALFSKKSIYSDTNVEENFTQKENDSGFGTTRNDDTLDKFSAVGATKVGNTYTNNWSNYSIEFTDGYVKASDDYDFYADGVKFDFGISFVDWSRIAVYYTRLAKDLSVVCANFAPGKVPNDVEIAGEIFKHVRNEVKYPYGVELYDYYLRAIDGKLMVIETYTEEGQEISQSYIDKFVKAK